MTFLVKNKRFTFMVMGFLSMSVMAKESVKIASNESVVNTSCKGCNYSVSKQKYTTNGEKSMRTLKELLDKNKAWAAKTKSKNLTFFENLSKLQKPKYLWIGCADSRVPATEIVDMKPGEIFVHRNIANVVVHTDLNCLSVIQYAVDVLKVEHIIVCGHYGCGGVKAAMSNKTYGLIDNWLGHIKDVYRYHKSKLDACKNNKDKINLMCELNVIEQVSNVCRLTVVKDAWRRGQTLSVHGWLYHLNDGIINDMGITVVNLAEAEKL
jgi:carbonic anhydrase